MRDFPIMTLYDVMDKIYPSQFGSCFYSYLSADIKAIVIALGLPEDGTNYNTLFDAEYMAHSGDKQVSRICFLYNQIDQGLGQWPDRKDRREEPRVFDDTFFKGAISIFNARHADNIKKIYEAYTTEYKPLENYSMIEDTDYTPLAKQTVKSSNKSKTDTTTDVGVFGFNSTVAVPSSSTDSGTTQLKADNEMETETSYDGKADNTHHERSGNIGVTTSQQMLESEIKLRKLEILELIFQGLDEVICQSVYD